MPLHEQSFRYWVGGVVTGMWAASLFVDMINVSYDPPAGMGTIMLAVATGIFGAPVIGEIRKRTSNGQ